MKAKRTEQIRNSLLIKNLRIRRADDKNIVIERFVQPVKEGIEGRWVVYGYYGKFEDLIPALTRLLVEIPKADDLTTQVRLLAESINNLRDSLKDIVRINSEGVAGFSGQDKEDGE